MSENEYNNNNPLLEKKDISVEDYLDYHKNKILQDSEKLFVEEFMYPILGKENLKYLQPQYTFVDSSGSAKKIDFALKDENAKLAFEIDGESYHAEGAVTSQQFDAGLERQNEILLANWKLLRFSYSQLRDGSKSKDIKDSIKSFLQKNNSAIVKKELIEPNDLQKLSLEALDQTRRNGNNKGIVILPTGTGKTFLSFLDMQKFLGKGAYIVHKNDLLMQTKEAFENVYSNKSTGLLTGDEKLNYKKCDVLFASKDSIRSDKIINELSSNHFDYLIIDEIHHVQAPTYLRIIQHFKPKFMLGITATPDRHDRKDIFELFDYNKIFESTLNEAIKNGFLVPFDYYGMSDNIDYSKIKWNGIKYNERDLEKHLSIKKRNEQILTEYTTKGKGAKTIGFCVNISHAEKMAKFFTENGIPAISITSETKDRKQKIDDFRDNKYSVAFAVDIFNEGMDFTNVRVLLFLRPSESKTIFEQQIGRGLRLHPGKEKTIILDFIADFKRANHIRRYLSTGQTIQKNQQTQRFEKLVFEYNPKCKIEFDIKVVQILDKMDREEQGITKEDLLDAYYKLKEDLKRKPTQSEINEKGEFKVARYIDIYKTWNNFLRDIGDFTESGYHFPQGTHLGHILYILKILGTKSNRKNTMIDEKYVSFGKKEKEKRLGGFQRQVKYKLQAMILLGWIKDESKTSKSDEYVLELTNEGKDVFSELRPMLNQIDLSFKRLTPTNPSSEMTQQEKYFNLKLKNWFEANPNDPILNKKKFLEIEPISLMLNYLYRIERKKIVKKSKIYKEFFKTNFVKQYCDEYGIESATEEGAMRRCPFLLNILETLGFIEKKTSDIEHKTIVISLQTLRINSDETDDEIVNRLEIFKQWKNDNVPILEDQKSYFKEIFGKDMLTKSFYLNDFEVI